jgi:putative transposase
MTKSYSTIQKRPYHVTTKTPNSEWFSQPIDKVWFYCQAALKEAHSSCSIEMISFVLMSNHYHLIVRASKRDLDLFVIEFNKILSRKFKIETEKMDQFISSSYKASLILSLRYLNNCYKYVYQNPVRAGIVSNCEEYPYSTLHSIVEGQNFSVPIFDQFGFKDQFSLRKLNQQMSKDELIQVRSNLYSEEIQLQNSIDLFKFNKRTLYE